MASGHRSPGRPSPPSRPGPSAAAARASGLPPEVRLDRAARALFADPVRYRLHDLEVISADFRPHLVVAEMLELAGHALGARLGIPVVTHGISPQYPSSMAPLFATALESARESAGPDVPSLAEYLAHPYLDLGPRSLVPPDPLPRRAVPIRPNPGFGSRDGLADLFVDLPHDRTVHLTLGTVVDREGAVLREAIDALRDLPVNLVVATGPGIDPAALRPRLDHVVVRDFVEHGEIMPNADVLVSQGGSGGLLSALSHGIPQVVVPLGADQFHNAEAVVRAGAGVAVTPFAVHDLRRAVEQALDDPELARGALRLRSEIRRMPSPEQTVPLLEALAYGEEEWPVAG